MFWGGGIVTNAMRKNKAELGGKKWRLSFFSQGKTAVGEEAGGI